MRRTIIGLRLVIRRHSALLSFWRCSHFTPCLPSPLPRLLRATRLIVPLRFPHSYALLVPDRAHRKLAVRKGYASEVPPREVGKHRVPLEAQLRRFSEGSFGRLQFNLLPMNPVSLLLHNLTSHPERPRTWARGCRAPRPAGRPPAIPWPLRPSRRPGLRVEPRRG
jgi:hypothetical protein